VDIFVSEYFNAEEELIDREVFDAVINTDNPFFINIIRLKKSTVPEFIDAYKHINAFFGEIATLLEAAERPDTSDVMYRAARSRFEFHEVNGINLGFARSKYGSGWGKKTSDRVCADAYQIVKKGSKQPELFHLVSLFEEDIAGDRLSDMIATIIEPYINKYTLRIMQELNISAETRPGFTFLPDGLVKNPYKDAPILLLPQEILHELPIAKDWDDIDRVATENRIIRLEVSAEVGKQWKKWASADKKAYLKKHVFMDPDVCNRVVDGYRSEELRAYDPMENPKYFAEMIFREIRDTVSFKAPKKDVSSIEATHAVIRIFKDWVENNRGWDEIQHAPKGKEEKSVQRLMHLASKYYVEVNNLDLSFESDAGRGGVDIKLSRGNDKTVAEVKLSSNTQYMHGYKIQVNEYGRAERTQNLIYVFIDVGNEGRRKNILTEHRKNIQKGIPCPDLVLIDARPKRSASVYTPIEADMDDFNVTSILDYEIDMPDFDFSGFLDSDDAES